MATKKRVSSEELAVIKSFVKERKRENPTLSYRAVGDLAVLKYGHRPGQGTISSLIKELRAEALRPSRTRPVYKTVRVPAPIYDTVVSIVEVLKRQT